MTGRSSNPLQPLFYPFDRPVPSGLRGAAFLLRPLRTTDVERDYAAVMDNPAALRQWAGGDWPADDFTIEENLADLELHEREHQERKAFTYTVMSLDETICLGCVYLDPLERQLRKGVLEQPMQLNSPGNFQVVVRFWVRHPLIAVDLDRHLFHALRMWLAQEWSFERITYRAIVRDERQRGLFEEAGLKVLAKFSIGDVESAYLIYGQG